jgi:hypothetical protein
VTARPGLDAFLDPGSGVLLEGFHALKHALRFGAEVTHGLAADRDAVLALARELAPDLEERIGSLLRPPPDAFDQHLAVAGEPVPPPRHTIRISLLELRQALQIRLQGPARHGKVPVDDA